MATYKSRARLGRNVFRSVKEGPAEITATVTIPAGKVLTSADKMEFFELGAGYRILEVTVVSGDLDSDGTPALTLNVGYDEAGGTADPDAFLAASTVGQAGGIVRVENGGDDPFAVGQLAAGTLNRVITITPVTSADAGPAADTNVSVTVRFVKGAYPAPDPNQPAYVYADRYNASGVSST